jgi:hypothetical protein
VRALGEHDGPTIPGGGETEAGVVGRGEQPVLEGRRIGERNDPAPTDGGDGREQTRPVTQDRVGGPGL